jgi:hypothetical protein
MLIKLLYPSPRRSPDHALGDEPPVRGGEDGDATIGANAGGKEAYGPR